MVGSGSVCRPTTEWFLVPLFVVDEVVKRFNDGTSRNASRRLFRFFGPRLTERGH
jgi:hypothetical protein